MHDIPRCPVSRRSAWESPAGAAADIPKEVGLINGVEKGENANRIGWIKITNTNNCSET